MKREYKKAFSVAELMVVMVLVCLVLVAIAPLITNKQKRSEEETINTTPNIRPGTIVAYYGSSVPDKSGWLLCDGQTFDQNVYPALYAALGNKTTTPNLKGYFIRGLDPNGTVDPYATENGGTARSLNSSQASANKKHYHGLYSTNVSGGESDKSFYPVGLGALNNKGISGTSYLTTEGSNWNFYYKSGYESRQLMTEGRDVSGANSTDSADAQPKNMALNYIIRAN